MLNRISPSITNASLVALVLTLLTTSHAKEVWEVVKHEGDDYVTTSNVKAFYKFEGYSEGSGGNIFFSTPHIAMKIRSGSRNLLINNTKFILSKPVALSDGHYLISRSDLVRLIEPVLRPQSIKKAKPFGTVILDPGHGGRDSGSAGEFGDEKGHTLRLALLVKAELVQRGLKVKMTRDKDQELTLKERVAFANKIKDSIFVSLHFNNGAKESRGVETYVLLPEGAAGAIKPENAHDIALATAVHSSVIHRAKPVDRGIRQAPWGVLKGHNRPAILLEAGYLTNPGEAKKISNERYLKEMAMAIADGIVTYRKAVRK